MATCHSTRSSNEVAPRVRPDPPQPRAITVALAGQPNVGKSTVFNMLTGLNQHVGNWPGKTVEQKSGYFNYSGQTVRLVDLPGTYSLTANSEEERIARDFILQDRPDVVIVILNAVALERSLYLVAELLLLPVPLVLGLNMVDVAEQRGYRVDTRVLAASLGVPVVPLVASKNRGVRELVEVALGVVEQCAATACGRACGLSPVRAPSRPTIRAEHVPVLSEIRRSIDGRKLPYPEDWAALKLLEGDVEVTRCLQQAEPEAWERIHPILLQHEDAYLDIVGARYEWIGRMVRAAVVRPRVGAIALTDRADRIATHPVWGMALLLGVLGLAFALTYTLATPIVGWLDATVVGPLAEAIRFALASVPGWLSGLVVDGLIGGAGTVLTFLPILIVFFAVLGLLEDMGYMARVAYVVDRFMHWMGLHGKSFLPLFLGFGCNVPAVMGARIVEDRRARLLTTLLAPFVPCTARLAVIAFLTPAFFGDAATLVSWGLVSANLIILALTGTVVHRLFFRGVHAAFIMEIPLYHLPNPRTIGMFVWHNTLAFVRKAGTIIVVVSAIVWTLSALPGDGENSALAGLGRGLAPLGRWMGIEDWRLIVALMTSFVAKENTIATLGILFGAGNVGAGLASRVAATLSPAGALAFLVVQMLFIPCVATVAVIKQEAGWKLAIWSVGLMTGIALLAGIVVYQLLAWV
ncbi:MAG: ferrous iron transport protein B [Chloroflexota bacterium]